MRKKLLLATPFLLGGLLTGPAFGAGYGDGSATGMRSAQIAAVASDEREDAQEHIRKAMQLVQKMKASPEAARMLSRSQGVFLVPDYARAALGTFGASGGAGVLLVKQGDSWSNPLFYNMGAVSAGVQAGISAGEVALALMNDKAVQAFRQDNKFSLDANSGLSIVDFSTGAQGSWGRGDIVLWTDTEGAYAGVSLAISDVNFDEEETRAYYGKPVTPSSLGSVAGAPQSATELKQALAFAR